MTLKAYIASKFQLYQLWRRVRHGGAIQQGRTQLESHAVQLFREPTPERISAGLQPTDLLLARLNAAARANGVAAVPVLLPLRVQLSDSSFGAFVASAGATPGEMPIGKPQREVNAIADRFGIPVIDLLPAFREWTAESAASLNIVWDGHWNEAGHALATRVLAEGLLRSVPGLVETRGRHDSAPLP